MILTVSKLCKTDASGLHALEDIDLDVLGAVFAVWRDVGHFFKTATADDIGTPNPVAQRVNRSTARGVSQSGNFLRGWLHLGFNQAEDRRRVHDGLWPIIAGRRIALNFRWAQPDGASSIRPAAKGRSGGRTGSGDDDQDEQSLHDGQADAAAGTGDQHRGPLGVVHQGRCRGTTRLSSGSGSKPTTMRPAR